MLSVHRVRLIPECVEPERTHNMTQFIIQPELTLKSTGLKKKKKLIHECESEVSIILLYIVRSVFFLNYHTLGFNAFHLFTQNGAQNAPVIVSFILNMRRHSTQSLSGEKFIQVQAKPQTRFFCNQTTLLEGCSAKTWFSWRAGPSSVRGAPCWGCTSRHSHLGSDASQPSCRRSRRRWTWWSHTSWKCGSVGDSTVNSDMQVSKKTTTVPSFQRSIEAA